MLVLAIRNDSRKKRRQHRLLGQRLPVERRPNTGGYIFILVSKVTVRDEKLTVQGAILSCNIKLSLFLLIS